MNGQPAMKKGRRRGRADGVSLAALLEARKLVNEAGSVEAVKETLAALARLV